MEEAILRLVVLSLAAASTLVMISSSASAAELTTEQQEEEPQPSTAAASAPLSLASSGLSVMQFRIGDTNVSGIVDTGSDLIWTNNSQVLDALPGDPSASSSLCKSLPFTSSCEGLCTFERQYGDGSADVRGVMGQAKLTFGSGYITPNPINLGSALNKQDCKKSYATGGMVGLGRGELSLVRQLWLSNFSYCLPPPETDPGYIRFNDTAKAAVSFEGRSTTTKLKKIQGLGYPDSSKYYVGLKGVRVCKDNVCQPKDHEEEDMFIDSGTALTHLPEKDFQAVKEHTKDLIKGEKLPETKDGRTCYRGKYRPTELLPNKGMDSSIALRFGSQGEEQMEIPAKYYFFETTTADGNVFCLAFKKKQEGKMSILGAYQQLGMHMLFDIEDNTLTFATTSACGQS